MGPIQLWPPPIWGRARSSSEKPTAFIMARAGARSGPSRRTRLLWRGSVVITRLPCRERSSRRGGGPGILQQVAERSQRIPVGPQALVHGGKRGDQGLPRPRHAVRVVEVEDGSRASAPTGAGHLHGRGCGPPPLCLHRPEDTRCPEPPQNRKQREIGHAPGRTEEAWRRSGDRADGLVAASHLVGRAPGTGEPEALVAPS